MPGELPFELGVPGPIRDRLVQAVQDARKIATSALLAQYEAEGEPLPVAGERRVLVDSAERPVGEVVLTEVTVIRLGDADDRLAIDEGEGFTSATEWRAAHEAFWREYALPDLPRDFALDDDSKVVVERFRLTDAE